MFGMARFPAPLWPPLHSCWRSFRSPRRAPYDAVTDFSLSSNPNGTWSYLYATPGQAGC